jgi:hypothetical protein
MIDTPHPVHTHSRSCLYIYIKCFITFNSGYGGHDKDVAPDLYMLSAVSSLAGNDVSYFFQKRHVSVTHNTQKEAPTHSFCVSFCQHHTEPTSPPHHAAEEEEAADYDRCRCRGVCRQ